MSANAVIRFTKWSIGACVKLKQSLRLGASSFPLSCEVCVMFGLGALFGQEPSAHRSNELEAAPGESQGRDAEGPKPSSVDPLSWGWGLASAVGTTVKAMQHEIVKSVQATDWKAELMAFGKEAAEEGKTLRHKTAELVEHLPDIADHLPEQVQQSAPVPSHHPDVANTLHQVGGSLKEFGHTLLVGTKELIEQ
ncbi:predicted protein, partial [Haematococcus lacustris]